MAVSALKTRSGRVWGVCVEKTAACCARVAYGEGFGRGGVSFGSPGRWGAE